MGQAVKEPVETSETHPPQDELEQIRHLVRLQSEIVNLARQNSEAERHYESLRKDLEAQFQRQKQPPLQRLWSALKERFRRLPGRSRAQRTNGTLTRTLANSPKQNRYPIDRPHK